SIMRGIPVSTGVGEVADTRGVPLGPPGGAPPPMGSPLATGGPGPARTQASSPPSPGLDVGAITQAYAGVPYTFGGPGGRGQGLGATTDRARLVAPGFEARFA